MVTEYKRSANSVGRPLTTADLELTGRTLDRLVRILASEEPPAVARLINTLTIARQDVDDAIAELDGGQR